MNKPQTSMGMEMIMMSGGADMRLSEFMSSECVGNEI